MLGQYTLQRAKPAIDRYFDQSVTGIFRPRDIGHILKENRADWGLEDSLSGEQFIASLAKEGKLRQVRLVSDVYPEVRFYAWGEVSPLAMALSARPHAYLSHGTAAFLHGLTEELPKTLYVNVEQSPKPQGGELSQKGLDAAFRRAPRTSNYILRMGRYQVVLLSGKFTNRLEVGSIEGPEGELLEATKLERTLIDITVRPVYAGGVYKVLDAFVAARERASVDTLATTLEKLDYLYPYHQAIGFYMTRAGYDPASLEPLRRLPRKLDFYLAHGLKEHDYDSDWRLSIPKGF